MQSNNPRKSFDCVAFMRQERRRISEKMEGMSYEEFQEWLDTREYSSPTLAKLAAEARASGKKTL